MRDLHVITAAHADESPKVRSTPTNSLVRKLNAWLNLIMTADRGESRNRRELVALLFALCFAAGTALAAPAADATDQFYDPEAVQTIHLEIKAEDLDRLHRALPQRIYVPCVFSWKGQKLENVGVRYKGNSSSNPDASHKRGFLIAFSEFKKGQRFLGLRHVALDNGIQFGSLFSERLITDALREVGVTTSRCNYARVYLNGKHAGVYVNVERIDKPFLHRHFKSDTGILFKVDEGGPGTDLRDIGSDPFLYQAGFEVKSDDKVEAFSALRLFIRAVDTPAGTEAELRRVFDVEPFVKLTAVMLLAGAFDQYTGWLPHNYYLYRNPADGRWAYIPWDLDVGFTENAFGRVPVLDGWHAAWLVPVPGRPLMERLLTHTNLLQDYRLQARMILEAWFRPEVLIPKLRGLHRQIQADLALDPYPPRRATVPSDTGYDSILASMESFIQKRSAAARAQLEAPGVRPHPTPMQPPADQEVPRPGPSSADAPTDLQAVKVTDSIVILRWTDHAQGEVAYVVQRCTGADCTNFSNAIGQEGRNITKGVDPHVRPGETYRYRVYAVMPTPHGPRGTGVSNEVTVRIP